MPQKTIIVSILCITILMIVWMIHNSHCEFRLNVTNGAIVIHTQRLKSDPGGNLLS
ncbi:Hok/Gef family protein [Escherichia coli]